MQENNEDEEKLVDVKGTIKDFVKEEKPELSQEEAIREYKEKDEAEVTTKNSKKSSSDDEQEDDEHLKRVKRALLESLERVNALAKRLFGDKEKGNLQGLKVKEEAQRSKIQNKSGGVGKGKKITEEKQDDRAQESIEKTRE